MEIKRILIVDDNADHADGLAMVLEDEGFSVKTVYSGNDAVNSLRSERFNLVLLDAKLPDTNGLRIYHQVMVENLADKIIIMTGFRLEQMIADAIPGTDLHIVRKIGNGLEGMIKQSLFILADPSRSPEKCYSSIKSGTNADLYTVDSVEDMDYVSGKEEGIIFIKSGSTALEKLAMYYELRIRNVLLPVVICLGSSGAPAADILRSFEETGCLFKPFTLEQMIKIVKRQTQEVEP